MKALVHLRSCLSYDRDLVLQAVESVLAASEKAGTFPDVKGKKVLLKPNMLLAADPERAVSTHPEVLRAVIRAFAQRGAKLVVGESPAVHSGLVAAKKCGLFAVSEEEGIPWVDFSSTVMVENPDGRLVKRFEIAQEAAEAELIVSLPKFKTHQLLYFTGAMKNLFGVISGLQKAAFHLRFPNRQDFAAMITDLCLALRPTYSIMDAVIGMEGKGPGNGDPRQVGLILGSADILALDWAAASIMGYEADRIPNLKDALGRGAWMTEPSQLEVEGSNLEVLQLEDFKIRNYKRVRESSDAGIGAMSGRGFFFNIGRNLLTSRPFFNDAKCIRCGECVAICPAKALSFVQKVGLRSPEKLSSAVASKHIAIDYDKCLRCYCCHEVCGVDAIDLKRRLF
ncbi:DUF362 domain-containing protein [Treponema sp.]